MKQTAERNQATGVVASMTGYGHGHLDIDCPPLVGLVTFEVRTVNSRFVDLQLRLADELRGLETALREAAGRHFRRGKVECRLSWKPARPSAAPLRLDSAVLDQLYAAQRQIRERFPEAASLSVAEILQYQASAGDRQGSAEAEGRAARRVDGSDDGSNDGGAGGSESHDPAAALQRAVAPLLERVFEQCTSARQREGARLADIIRQQLASLREVASDLRPRIPALLADAQEKLSARLADALPAEGMPINRDETLARVRQEVAMLSLRGDIAEELDRLETHVQEVGEILDGGGPVGKRLDFLSQELNREANTIASKAVGIAVTDAAVALKLAIEQLREQVQNLE